MLKPTYLALIAAASISAQSIQLDPPPRRYDEPVAALKAEAPVVRASDWINTAQRQAVGNFYLSGLAPLSQVPLGFTGNVTSGNAGGTSAAYKTAVLSALNWYRSMAGVPSLAGLDPVKNAKNQQGALMMSANKALSHNPPTSWMHYSAAGAEAAGNSNICYQYSDSSFSPGCVRAYMNDNGGGNYAAGHRRWILYPQTQMMGTGDVDGRGEPGFFPLANTQWAWDGNFGGQRPATRDNFVAWPPRGYVPYQTVFARWSFSVSGANFSQAAVTVRLNGSVVSVSKEPVDNGYGENTLVFVPNINIPQAPAQDQVVDVTISNVGVGGAQPATYQYTTIIFDPISVGPPSGPTLGAYIDGSWFVDRNGDFGFNGATEQQGWGSPGDLPLQGDWNGDGFDDLGVFSNGLWIVDLNGDGAFNAATEMKGWGAQGWLPMPGDWNGDGVTDLGAIDPSTMAWFLDLNGDMAFDPATEIRGWGSPGDTPVRGDWDGDGDDDIGVFAGGVWFLDRDGNGTFNPATEMKGWGVAGWTPVVGDWDGDGDTDIGAVNPANMNWFRDMNGDFNFNSDTDVVGWGPPGSTPVVADWNSDGADDVGVFIDGTWFIDRDGNQAFDAATEIKGWGAAGWTPVAGNWQ